jgi:hypothetical protein
MVQTKFNSAQLAAGASADDILTSDGTDNVWRTGASVEIDKWLTAAADSGSEAATTNSSTLTIAGGDGISTALTGNGVAATITIDADVFDGKVKINVNDPTESYLEDALLAGDGISLSVAGDNETMTVDVERRQTYGFGSTTPMIGAGTTVLTYGSASQWAIVPKTGTATHVSFYLQGWVDDPDVDIILSHGTLGAETNLTVVNNVAAASGAQAIASPPSVSAGDVLFVSVVNTGGDDVIATFSVTILMEETV